MGMQFYEFQFIGPSNFIWRNPKCEPLSRELSRSTLEVVCNLKRRKNTGLKIGDIVHMHTSTTMDGVTSIIDLPIDPSSSDIFFSERIINGYTRSFSFERPTSLNQNNSFQNGNVYSFRIEGFSSDRIALSQGGTLYENTFASFTKYWSIDMAKIEMDPKVRRTKFYTDLISKVRGSKLKSIFI